MTLTPLPRLIIEPLVRAALVEDLGRAGDITTDAIVPADDQASMAIVARQAGTAAGLDLAALAFELVDPRLAFGAVVKDGAAVKAGAPLALVRGPARGLLTAERVALNFLGRMSGIATATAAVVKAIQPHVTRVVCTRKTTPLLRSVEKYAVRAGGGANHRFGLDDAVLIKDNHIAVAGGVTWAIQRARAAVGHLVKIEVEVDTLAQLEEALAAGAEAVLLDNMSLSDLRTAVALCRGKAVAEASGGINLTNAAEIAATGVDIISLGWLTHSVAVLDVGLDDASC
jgi:nicotinate-nucleotide pyrophosphorylase (carboxylating)